MMSSPSPYLLFAEASRNYRTADTWRFVLQNLENDQRLSASDQEAGASRERLELLAVVRGLEALAGPARVTLVTNSRYVSRGIKLGLDAWRANRWCWERFGKMVQIRDHDLWQRVDRALEFHQVVCQTWHFEEAPVAREASHPQAAPADGRAAPTPQSPVFVGSPRIAFPEAEAVPLKRRRRRRRRPAAGRQRILLGASA